MTTRHVLLRVIGGAVEVVFGSDDESTVLAVARRMRAARPDEQWLVDSFEDDRYTLLLLLEAEAYRQVMEDG